MSAAPVERWRQRLHETFGLSEPPAVVDAPRRQALLEQAAALRAEARRREATFGTELFAAPAFDLLLDLYLAAHGRPVDRTAPGASWRWFAAMEDRGLVERERDADDPCRARLRLTAAATAALEQFLDGA